MEKCAFDFCGICSILTEYECEGCKFYKTKAKLIEDRDYATKICREKGLCKKCTYHDVPCELSTEKGDKHHVFTM